MHARKILSMHSLPAKIIFFRVQLLIGLETSLINSKCYKVSTLWLLGTQRSQPAIFFKFNGMIGHHSRILKPLRK